MSYAAIYRADLESAHSPYVCITPQDVYQQYIRAVAQLVRPTPPSHA